MVNKKNERPHRVKEIWSKTNQAKPRTIAYKIYIATWKKKFCKKQLN